MPRYRHSICVYWTSSVLFMIVLISRLLTEEGGKKHLHQQTRFLASSAGVATDNSSSTSDISSHNLNRCSQSERLHHLNLRCDSDNRKSTLVDRWRSPEQNLGSDINKQTKTNGYDFLLVDDVHKIIFCAIPKAASTTFKQILARAAGSNQTAESISEHQVEDSNFMASLGLRFLSTYSQSDVEHRLKEYTKFVVVRHPLSRLVSAYNDKVARFNSYGMEIRQTILRRYANASGLTEASNAVAAVAKHSGSRLQRVEFPWFIRYVLDEAELGRFDHHWSPYDKLCHFCRVHYDHVIKVETLDADSADILVRLGLSNSGQLPRYNSRSAEHRQAKSSSPAGSTVDKELKEFKELSKQEVDKLTSYYADDMAMFGYSYIDSFGANGHLTATCQLVKSPYRTCC